MTARVTQVVVKSIGTEPSTVRLTQARIEVLGSATTGVVRLSQAFIQVVADHPNPPARISNAYIVTSAESAPGEARVAQMYFEMLVDNINLILARGGARPGGAASPIRKIYANINATGGGRVGGEGDLLQRYFFNGLGGARVGGAIKRNNFWWNVASGGARCGGTAGIAFIQQTSGGVLGGGTSTVGGFQGLSGTGGARCGGTATVQYIPLPTAGVRCGGTSLRSFIWGPKPTGGVVCGGDVPQQQITPTFGGAVVSGLAEKFGVQTVELVSAGVRAGGLARLYIDFNPRGGVRGGGTNAPRAFYQINGTGGGTPGGTALSPTPDYIGLGGVLCAGSAPAHINQVPGISGGAVCSGLIVIDHVPAVSGGSLAGGEALVGQIMQQGASGGAVCAGVAIVGLGYIGQGGAVMNGGNHINQFYYFPGTGGAVVRCRSLLNLRLGRASRKACRQDQDNMCCVRKPDPDKFEVTKLSLSNGQVEGKLAAVAVCRLNKYKKKSYSNFEGQITKRFVKPITKRSNTTLYR